MIIEAKYFSYIYIIYYFFLFTYTAKDKKTFNLAFFFFGGYL
jgi:hypothetical protein